MSPRAGLRERRDRHSFTGGAPGSRRARGEVGGGALRGGADVLAAGRGGEQSAVMTIELRIACPSSWASTSATE